MNPLTSTSNILRFQRTLNVLGTLRRLSTDLTIPALIDSHPIATTLFSSASSAKKPIAVVISQATGSRREFYFPFADYLSGEHDLDVFTYDYRGTHERKPTDWTLVEHWARRDSAGVLTHCFDKYEHVVHLGHSLGGNLLALLPPSINQRISRALLIATANSYLMYHKWNRRFITTCLALHVIREPLVRFYGYYPMRTFFRTGVDLPKNIVRQWARWSLHRQCFVDDQGESITEGFTSVRCPVVTIHFEDDEFYTRQAFDRFTDSFQHSSHLQRWHLPRGGHFNFFKETLSRDLWSDVVPYLKGGTMNLSRHSCITSR